LPSASVQNDSTDNGGAWLKERAQWKLQQMSGVQPVTLPNPPKIINACMWLWWEGVSVVQGAVPCQQHWQQVDATILTINKT
jgi:hypothetical protein